MAMTVHSDIAGSHLSTFRHIKPPEEQERIG
jgi:hypothetical protein